MSTAMVTRVVDLASALAASVRCSCYPFFVLTNCVSLPALSFSSQILNSLHIDGSHWLEFPLHQGMPWYLKSRVGVPNPVRPYINLGLVAGGVGDRYTGVSVSSSQSDSDPGCQNSSWAYTLFQPSCINNTIVGLMVMMGIVVDWALRPKGKVYAFQRASSS
ncbi:hypothetical protein L1987_53015 [Smallanthus sonchifolius]|uniref:Uncharacterized protein n=1 Tax=Smallanthus sonchifolius TaxID=185202 RepID=A0ACB9EVW4_9ASTR|nr:hypothetical protein L1987_53015 [Smallanthus sonchifolius]